VKKNWQGKGSRSIPPLKKPRTLKMTFNLSELSLSRTSIAQEK